jgi:catechol 1,2-dioxygenase
MEAKAVEAVVARVTQTTPGREADLRVKSIVDRIVRDLMHTMNDFDVTPDEFWKACDYLTRLGKSGEAGLLAPGLGFEHFLDLLEDERDAKAGLNAAGTPRTIEGPLYVIGAPEHRGFGRLDIDADADALPLFMSGVVRDLNGRPVPGAKVEVWHANSKGGYSVFDSSQTPFNNRGTIIADANGRYAFRSTMPSGYSCPPGSCTQELLDRLGRHGSRPAHIHFFVSAPGFRKLTTQINIQGDPLIDDDFAFATRDGLVPDVRHVSDPAAMAARGVDRPFAEIEFGFTMVEAREGLADGEVERPRVAA